jgi:hypothetical protein
MMKRTLIFATTTCLWTSACNTPKDMVVDMAPDLTPKDIAVDMAIDMAPDLAPTIRYADIQADLKLLNCTAVACHDANAANKLRIDLTAGQERSNYDAMLAQGMLIPGSPNTSPLIVVPATGTAAGGVSHVKTLTGTKLSNWTVWVQAGAPY